MISREKTSIRKYKKRETLSLSISLPAQRILLKIWEMSSNAINNTLLKNKNFWRWSRKNWSFLNGMTHTNKKLKKIFIEKQIVVFKLNKYLLGCIYEHMFSANFLVFALLMVFMESPV